MTSLTRPALSASVRVCALPPRSSGRLHPLKGNREGRWSVRVSGNWLVVFRFDDGEAMDVELIEWEH